LRYIHDEKEFFDKYFNLIEGFDFETHYLDVLKRKEFYLNKWLMKNDLNLSADELNHVTEKFMSLYDNDYFYEECEPTQMAEGIVKLSLQSFVKKIHIVTRTTPNTHKSKKRFLDSYFSNPRFNTVFIEPGEKKSEFIKTLDDVDMFVDDELSNIHDFLDNTKHKNTDIYVPLTGYNEPDMDFFEKIDASENKILYYPIYPVSDDVISLDEFAENMSVTVEDTNK